jgi:hypothetical protein
MGRSITLNGWDSTFSVLLSKKEHLPSTWCARQNPSAIMVFLNHDLVNFVRGPRDFY